MVTGDNILTAISVANSCNIISKNKTIYYGDLEQDKKSMKSTMVWTEFNNSEEAKNKYIKKLKTSPVSKIGTKRYYDSSALNS